MANRVVISICGEEYTFVAEESASYMHEAGKAQSEASDLKREVFRLQQKLDSLTKNRG